MSCEYPLEEIAVGTTVFSGFAFKSNDFSEEGIPVVKIKNVNNRVVDLSGVQYFPENKVSDKHTNFFLQDKDVLIAMTGQGSVGRVGRIRLNEGQKVLINQRVGKFVVDEKNLNQDYLYYVLSSPIYEQILFDTGTGSGQPNLSPKLILQTEIPLPPYDIQRKIGKILSTLDEKIYLNIQMNQIIEKIAQTIFKHWFIHFEFPKEDSNPYKSSGGELVYSDLGKIPKNWKVTNLGDIISITSGKRPEKKSDSKNENFPVPLIGSSSLMGFVKKSLYNVPILVIGRVGTLGIVQRILPPSFPSDNTLVIKSKYYEFVYQTLKRIDYESLNVGTTQPLITQKSIKQHEIVIPPQNLLKQYEEISSKLFLKLEANKHETIYLSEIRDSLLPKFISGKLKLKLSKEAITK